MWHGGKQLPHSESVEFPVASKTTVSSVSQYIGVDLCSTAGKFLANELLMSLGRVIFVCELFYNEVYKWKKNQRI